MTTERRHPNVVNASDVKPYEEQKGKHHIKGHTLGMAAGSKLLGATLTEIPPGCLSFPFHYHCATEEAVYIISGSGIARIGDQRVPVRAGDFIAYPIGPEHAHQMINDGTEPLIYLCMSNKVTADVVGYPDSKKIGTRAGSFDKPWIRTLAKEAPPLDYWEGEPEA
jgi:uncharacterized cupin superfamily protein